MGQESSTPIDEHTPPEALEARTVDAVAEFIKEGRAKNIVVMVGFMPFEYKTRLLWHI